VDYALNA